MTMNSPSPLIPQGSMLEQKNKGRARVKIAVFVVLAIHGIGLLALLMQGCKKEPDTNATAAATDQATNTSTPTFEQTNLPVADNNPPATPTNPPTTMTAAQPSAPASSLTDYKIAQGDTFSTLAKKFHVSVKAIEEANPGVEATKLKIGQTVHIPAPVVAAAGTSAPSGTADTGNAGQMYVVKSGDSLSKIAGEFAISVKALRSANNLTTDKIVVGQKLKLPVKAPATGAAIDSTSTTTASSGTSNGTK
jgi:LysM repeat protein